MRRQAVDFSTPWLDVPLSVLIRRDTDITSLEELLDQETIRYGVSINGIAMMKFFGTREEPYSRPVQCQGRELHQLREISFWGSSKNESNADKNVQGWKKAVSEAEKIVGYPTSFMSLRCLLSDELSNVAIQMRKLVGTGHPLLQIARKFFFDGKHNMQMRGLLVLLVSKAAGPVQGSSIETRESMVSGIYPSQRSVAEITEMIHTAKLIHRGVINLAELASNRDASLHDMIFGNKIAVLSGDFLLANASAALAALHNTKVVEIMSSAITDLMQAEFTRFSDHNNLPPGDATVSEWEDHTFLASGSLIAKSCKSALMIGQHSEEMQQKMFDFGRHVAFARQLYDDLQPFTSPTDTPDQLNPFSIPVILASLRQHSQEPARTALFGSLAEKKQLFRRLYGSDIIEEARTLCHEHGLKAIDTLSGFSDSDAKLALTNMTRAMTAV
ncbi:Decaprenyl-diphosphate synthase subunit 2 [Lamellibrachia satsuma]|nr:Decaprenyl-diphosphate synthase subunit 2 [Lamellibrachia satsuma]